MAWPLVFAADAWADLNEFENPEPVLDELFEWAKTGPPADHDRDLFGATIYDDETVSGVRFQYFIGTKPRAFIAMLRIRPPL